MEVETRSATVSGECPFCPDGFILMQTDATGTDLFCGVCVYRARVDARSMYFEPCGKCRWGRRLSHDTTGPVARCRNPRCGATVPLHSRVILPGRR